MFADVMQRQAQAPSRLGSALRERLAAVGRKAWLALEREGQRRARPELLAAASRLESTQPDVAARLRAAASAGMVP